jgi:hypothetical protein
MRQPRKRPAARRRRTLANLPLMAASLAIAGGLTAAVLWLVQRLQGARCPAGTFLYGSGGIATVVQYVAIILAALAWGVLAANFLAREAGPQRELLGFCVLLSAAALPAAGAAALCQYCLFADGISDQPYPWTGLGRYRWQDVAAIETSCARGRRGGWSGSFVLVLGDGARFDIMAWPRAATRAYPDLVAALAHGNFTFDRSGVRAGCDVPYREMLTRRP